MTAPDFLPRNVPLPEAVVKADAAREAAHDAYAEQYLKYSDVLDDTAMERAAARDQEAARQAIHAGDDLSKLSSEVDRVRSLQPMARGIVQGLAEKVRAADTAVYRAWIGSLPDTLPVVDELRAQAESDLKAAEAAYLAARSRFRGLVSTTAYVRLQRAGKVRTLVDAPNFSMSTRDGETHSDLATYWLMAHGVPDAE
ncbi:hypothetical protein [Streptomyces sp. NPDC047070]|uniref:hypothetical protein n=1 Tax=Streptomyces sp. NPDC047070 TaxID=3154923 RepID=UPI00345164ED